MSFQFGINLYELIKVSLHNLYTFSPFLYPYDEHISTYRPHIKLNDTDKSSNMWFIIFVLNGFLSFLIIRPLCVIICASLSFNFSSNRLVKSNLLSTITSNSPELHPILPADNLSSYFISFPKYLSKFTTSKST